MEARLIALLLGELPGDSRRVRAAIATNPELARLHERLKQTISLVREATAKVTEPASEQAAPLRLSEERREKLLAHFKTVKPKEFVPENPVES
jgi:anti-sigma factor RsiW